MDLGELRSETRRRLADLTQPYLWSDDEINRYLNEAEREACIRARLIEDTTSEATELDVVTTEKRYALHDSVLDVLRAELASRPGKDIGGWTLTETEIVFDEYPRAADTLLMTVIRMPIEDMVADGDTPEIRPHHHLRLIDWATRCCYLKQDADTFDKGKAIEFEAAFVRSFGERPDANVQRKQRAKTGRVVRYNGAM